MLSLLAQAQEVHAQIRQWLAANVSPKVWAGGLSAAKLSPAKVDALRLGTEFKVYPCFPLSTA